MVPSREACTNTVMVVHHARDAIKAEAVELVFLHPESQVAEQEPKNFVVAVVEQTTVPQLVSSSAAFMEVEVVRSIKVVQPVQHVFARMRVNDVEEDSDTHAVRRVDEFLQLFRSAVARASREETSDLITKRCASY